MNCSQPGTDKLRINTVIITYYGNLIRNLNPMVKEIVHSLNRSVIRRKRQCLYFKETGKQFFIPAEALSLLPRNYDQTGFAAETALLFHSLFKSVPSAGITVLICLCDKQCPVVSTGIQVFSNLISTGIIVNSYILEGIFPFRIYASINIIFLFSFLDSCLYRSSSYPRMIRPSTFHLEAISTTASIFSPPISMTK